MTKNRKWHVEVDSKEEKNHDLWFEDGEIAANLPGTFAFEGFSYSVASRLTGDFRITSPARPFEPGLLVESKTWDDFHASLRDSGSGRADSRMRHQLAGLLAAKEKGDIPVILVVGIMTLAGGRGAKAGGVYVQNKGRRQKRNWSFYELEQARAAVQRLGIMTYQAPSEFEVPRSLRMLAELCSRDEHFQPPGLPQQAMLAPRLSFLATQLTGVTGISRARAIPIAMRYRTFSRFYKEATVEELMKFEGIGKVLAQQLYTAFHEDQPDGNVDLSELELEALV